MTDGLSLVAALAALVLLVVGVRVLLHALDVHVIRLWPERTRITGDDAFATSTEGFMFRRHWGSFGGESTGWNMSARLARLLSGALLVTSAVAMLMLLLHVDNGSGAQTTAKADGPAKPEKAQK